MDKGTIRMDNTDFLIKNITNHIKSLTNIESPEVSYVGSMKTEDSLDSRIHLFYCKTNNSHYFTFLSKDSIINSIASLEFVKELTEAIIFSKVSY